MTERSQAGKHRAARRPTTPLTVLVDNLGEQAGVIGRRTAVVALSSGLIVSGAGAAQAAEAAVAKSPVNADTAALAASARTLMGAKSIVQVDASADWSLATPQVEVKEPATKAGRAKATPISNPQLALAASTDLQTAGATAAGTEPTNTAGGSTGSTAERSTSKFQTNGNAVLEVAKRYIGTPYVFGGTTPSGFDCSGFTQYVYKQLGYNISRTTYTQINDGRHVSAKEAKPGDLYISPGMGHVVIYAGGNMMIDSARTGTTISFRQMRTWNGTFVRIID